MYDEQRSSLRRLRLGFSVTSTARHKGSEGVKADIDRDDVTSSGRLFHVFAAAIRKAQSLGLHSVERRRLNSDLILVYKIFNGLFDINLSNDFQFQQFNTRGHSFKLVRPYCSRNICKHFFSNHTIATWNLLSSAVISCQSLHAFKHKLYEIDL